MSRNHRAAAKGNAIALALVTLVATVTGEASAASTSSSAAAPSSRAVRPDLDLRRVIRTAPFNNSSTSAKDNEGSAYVPRDKRLWLADDDGRSLYALDPRTGALKRTIGPGALEGVRRYGGGSKAGPDRVRDLESIAYDAARRRLYVFSGSSSSDRRPTVFRLDRGRRGFHLHSYQSLPQGADFTAAAWRPGSRRLFVGVNGVVRPYNYEKNDVGPARRIRDVNDIYGMSFSRTGKTLYIARSGARIGRVSWKTKRLMRRWSFDLSSSGMLDTRAVERVKDRFYVSDGADTRSNGDRRAHAVFVFEVDR